MASVTDLTTGHLKAKQTKYTTHLLQARSQKRKVNHLPKPVGKILDSVLQNYNVPFTPLSVQHGGKRSLN